MSAERIFWGQVLAQFLIILASIWAAIQWTASALGFQVELSAPWFAAFGHPVYRPYDLFCCWFSYGAYAPEILDRGGMIARRHNDFRRRLDPWPDGIVCMVARFRSKSLPYSTPVIHTMVTPLSSASRAAFLHPQKLVRGRFIDKHCTRSAGQAVAQMGVMVDQAWDQPVATKPDRGCGFG